MNADLAALRERILARRRGLRPEEIQARSSRVCARFLESAQLPRQAWGLLKIGLYQGLPGELRLEELERALALHGSRLHFPRVAGKAIEFAANPGDRWREGPYGIQEPHPEIPAVDPGELDLVVVPGVAFGRQGERLGMGAGYYDRFLARVPRALRVVLAFDFQLLEELEQREWDQPVDWIVCETDEVRGARVEGWLENFRGA